MASDCIFYSESIDMGATIPFCNFESSSKWSCCEYYDHRDSTQELCPHYISRKDGLEILRKTHRPMTNREKIKQEMVDQYLWHYVCCESTSDGIDCKCPIKKLCDLDDIDAALKKFTEWLDEEAE